MRSPQRTRILSFERMRALSTEHTKTGLGRQKLAPEHPKVSRGAELTGNVKHQ